MKKLFLLAISISLISLNINAQQVPVFKGTTYENNDSMGDDQIDISNLVSHHHWMNLGMGKM